MQCDDCERTISPQDARLADGIYPDTGLTLCPACATGLRDYADKEAGKYAEEDANQPAPIPGYGR
jgi:hypothetical protein